METGQHHACHAVGQVVGKILKTPLTGHFDRLSDRGRLS